MNLPPEDQQFLEELCRQHGVSAAKVLQLLNTVREYEFKDRRTGVYPALKPTFRTPLSHLQNKFLHTVLPATSAGVGGID